MSGERKCPTCGAGIPEGTPEGMCPVCLLAEATGEEETLGVDGKGSSGKQVEESPATDPIEGPQVNSEGPGTVLGPYKLLQQIGEGGFGFVFVAEQKQPIRRKVALKILKPGMDSKEVITRFEAERQALALMDHSHIAKVLDAGTTETGRPYFAMELVHGVPITDYCDTHRLEIRDRLKLFQDVCAAVQHAHQKGIIHRDLKPSNILVELHDTKPVVKVIDFGVAKAISQQLAERTLFTAYGQMIGTPQYMSPEQSEMSGLDVDTRSDIYSLGVVLYELLTGKTPLELQQLRQAGLAEIHRLIREEEPPKPSTKLSSLSNEESTAIANAHRVAPEKLNRLVRGDLDWIVMRALEKDRTRRYETASAFAEDVENYLEDQPVEASPPSTAYRLGKFVRRNKAALSTASILVVILLAASILSIRWAIEAERAKTLAEERLIQAEAIPTFIFKALGNTDPDMAGRSNGIAEVLRTLEKDAQREFSEQPLVLERIRQALAKSYLDSGAHDDAQRIIAVQKLKELGFGETNPSSSNMGSLLQSAEILRGLGDFESALAYSQRAYEVHWGRNRHGLWFPSGNQNTLITFRQFGLDLIQSGRTGRARQLLTEGRNEVTGKPYSAVFEKTYSELEGLLALKEGDGEAAAERFEEVVSATLRIDLSEYGSVSQSEFLRQLKFYVDSLTLLEETDTALLFANELAWMVRGHFGASHPNTSRAYLQLADLWVNQGSPETAAWLGVELLGAASRDPNWKKSSDWEALSRRLDEILVRLEDPPDPEKVRWLVEFPIESTEPSDGVLRLPPAVFDLAARVGEENDRYDRAGAWHQLFLERLSEAGSAHQWAEHLHSLRLVALSAMEGRAASSIESVLAIVEESGVPRPIEPWWRETLIQLADAREDERADRLGEALLSFVGGRLSSPFDCIGLKGQLYAQYFEEKRYQDGVVFWDRYIDAVAKWRGEGHSQTFWPRWEKGRFYLEGGLPVKAEEVLLECLSLAPEGGSEENLAMVEESIGRARMRLGRLGEAREILDSAWNRLVVREAKLNKEQYRGIRAKNLGLQLQTATALESWSELSGDEQEAAEWKKTADRIRQETRQE